MGMIAGMIGPVCMIVIGMLIGSLKWKQVLAFKRLPLVVFLRLVFFPLIMLAVCKFIGLHTSVNNGTTILLISLLAAITPSASTITQMSQIYDKNAEYASVINVVTTLLCIITMPVIVFLYQI
jgi:predicted permease